MTSVTSNSGHLLHNLLLFGRVLRGLGLPVPGGRMLDVVRALDHVGLRRRTDFQATLRTILVSRQRDLAVFDEAFQVFWRPPKSDWTTRDLRSLGEQRRYRRPQIAPPADPDSDGDGSGPNEDQVDLTRTYSAREVLRTKDFADFNGDEISEAKRVITELAWELGQRRTRRWVHGSGARLDLRHALRSNLRYGGELLELPRLQRKEKTRPLVLVCDVSGSMERYTRMLLHFIHGVSGSLGNVESFLFATRLTRITGQLEHRSVDEAVRKVSQTVPDWAGGTRIGETLRVFNLKWARRVLGWGAIVLIISDGWDRGQPDLLRREMARLQRSCHRLIWLNPLLGSSSYQPLTRGMQVALPLVDDHLPVHNLASLQDLATHLASLSPQRPGRRQQPVLLPATADSIIASGDPRGRQVSRHAGAKPTFRHPMWGRGSE